MKEKSGQDKRLLREIRLTNLLSFGPDTKALPLERLNVFIGPNGSGKSNLIEALALMRATPVAPQTTSNTDVLGVLRRGGGVREWIWKGAKDQPARMELVMKKPGWNKPLRHVFAFIAGDPGFLLQEERVEDANPHGSHTDAYFYYGFNGGHPMVKVRNQAWKKLGRKSVNAEVSILAQRRDPDRYPEITYLAETYGKFRIYREWSFGRNTVFREPQKADMRNDRLEEDFSNLGLFLNRLRRVPKAKAAVLASLRDLYEGLTDFDVSVEGGSVQVFFTEGDYTIPATRLSDGTLRYLCILAILNDSTPPPLICIEEPELGLHPDILPRLADMLVAASERTQLIVTTHSDILVDAMTEHPEAVVVCEKHDGKTEMTRLSGADLAVWLKKYRLGQLWIEGQLGREALVSAYIYLEGGASGPSSKNLTIRCQQAFHTMLDRMGFAGRKPRLKACGGRASVYEDFCTAHEAGGGGYVAMWIDSEEPMVDVEQAWKHLAEVRSVASWAKPEGAADEQVLFMTTCMETRIVADRAALRSHYGHKLSENALPPLNGLEGKGRHDVQGGLERATKECKNAYAKGKRSFDVLEELEPAVLRLHLPSFVRVERILKDKL